jgi:hypothetical protein
MHFVLAVEYLSRLLSQLLDLWRNLPNPAAAGLAVALGYLLYRGLGNSRSAPSNRRA